MFYFYFIFIYFLFCFVFLNVTSQSLSLTNDLENSTDTRLPTGAKMLQCIWWSHQDAAAS